MSGLRVTLSWPLLADAGPGVVWLPFLLVALLVAVMLLAAVPPDEAARWRWAWPRGRRTAVEDAHPGDPGALVAEPVRRAAGVGLLGWVLLGVVTLLLLIALLVR